MMNNHKDNKSGKLFTLIFVLLCLLCFGFLLGREYYWRWQIKQHGIVIAADVAHYFTRQKPLEPTRYFAQFTFQTLRGEKVFISEKVEIGAADKDKYQQKLPVLIRYLPQNPIKILPIDKPKMSLIHFAPDILLLFFLLAAIYAFWDWKKTNKNFW